MIRLQDIAEMAGVSRTTVSNVRNGNTKRVRQELLIKSQQSLKNKLCPTYGVSDAFRSWFQNHRCSTWISLCTWYAVSSGSVCR